MSDKLTVSGSKHEDRMDLIKVIVAVVVGTILVASVLVTAVVSVSNRILGDSNHSLLATYVTEQQNLTAAGVEQEKFAAWIVSFQSANCSNQLLIEAKLDITNGVPCPPLPNFAPLPGTTTKPPTTKK